MKLAKRPPLRRARVAPNKTALYAATGGPYNGKMLLLSSPGTLPFTVDGYHGYYNHYMEWRNTK